MKEQKQTPVSYVGKHTFTDQEKDSKLKQMLAAMRVKQELEDEFKTTKSTYKAKIDAKDAEIKLMSNLLNAGQEDRTYQTLLTLNFEEGKKYWHEVGTNALVGEEPLTAADYQTQMDLEEKAIQENNQAADNIVQLTPEQIEIAEAGPESNPFTEPDDYGSPMPNEEPAYTVEPESNPLEFDELGAVEEPKPLEEAQPFDAVDEIEPIGKEEEIEDDPFALGDDPKEGDPFSFDDI